MNKEAIDKAIDVLETIEYGGYDAQVDKEGLLVAISGLKAITEEQPVDVEALKQNTIKQMLDRPLGVTAPTWKVTRLIRKTIDHLHAQGLLRTSDTIAKRDVPEGYALVPIDPTEAMNKAGIDAVNAYIENHTASELYDMSDEALQAIGYKAMIQAALADEEE